MRENRVYLCACWLANGELAAMPGAGKFVIYEREVPIERRCCVVRAGKYFCARQNVLSASTLYIPGLSRCIIYYCKRVYG